MNKFRLNTPFVTLQSATYAVFVIWILAPFFFPQYFKWISNINAYILSSIFFIVLNTIIALFAVFIKNKIYFKYLGYVWSIWYLIIIILTGGVDSTFTFAFIYLPVISVSYLDLKLTKNLGILSAILLTLVIFFDPNGFSPSNITLHALHIIAYSVLVFFVYKFVKDILYHKYHEEEAKRKFTELSEIDHVKEIFLQSMSHQLRTPLTATKWALDYMISNENKVDPAMLKEGYSRVNQAIEIIGEILKTAEFGINAKLPKIDKNKISLAKLVKDCVNNLTYSLDIKNVKLVYGEMDDIFVFGDEKLLNAAVSNVIDNAIRYSPGGTVKISLNRVLDKAKIEVADTGIGIDPADMEYIFQKFYRGKNALLIDPNESGIGLYTAKKILELHGGEIKLFSVLKRGTTVQITLPYIIN